MNPLNKIVSLFQSDANNNRGKKLIVQQKFFCSELNIACNREELRKNHYWGTQTLNGYKRSKGNFNSVRSKLIVGEPATTLPTSFISIQYT